MKGTPEPWGKIHQIEGKGMEERKLCQEVGWGPLVPLASVFPRGILSGSFIKKATRSLPASAAGSFRSRRGGRVSRRGLCEQRALCWPLSLGRRFARKRFVSKHCHLYWLRPCRSRRSDPVRASALQGKGGVLGQAGCPFLLQGCHCPPAPQQLLLEFREASWPFP